MGTFGQVIGQVLQHPYVAIIILTALVFDFVNGFHDAANSVATIVGTRVLRPLTAVLWAAFWNFAAMWIFGFLVASTVSKWVNVEFVTNNVVFAGLLGAIVWNLITWYAGLPSSSSHALLGGLCGAAIVNAFLDKGVVRGVVHGGNVLKTVEFIVIAPVLGMVLGLALITLLMWGLRYATPRRVDKTFRGVQLLSAAAYSLGHGTNDAQKTMGIIAALLYTPVWTLDQQKAFDAGHVPFWIVLACFLTIGFGTMAGGWRVVKTMGMKITKLRPYQGACAETAAAATLFLSTHFGIPVSTTHTITGAIVGVGSVQRLSAVRWGVARSVVVAWLLTIPAAAILGAVFILLIRLIHPA